MFISRHTLKWTKTCRSSGDFPHAHTAHFLLNRHIGRLFTALQEERIVGVEIRVLAMGSTGVKVHQHAAGAPKKGAPGPSASPGEGGTPKSAWYPTARARSSRSI